MKKYNYFFFFLLFVSCQSNKSTNPEVTQTVEKAGYVNNTEVKQEVRLLGSRNTTTRYGERDLGKDNFGIQQTLKYFEINTVLKNNSSKGIKKVFITVYFKDKNSDPQDYTSNVDTYESDVEIDIKPGAEVNVTFTVFPKDDINMVYNSSNLERIIYSDGSYVDL